MSPLSSPPVAPHSIVSTASEVQTEIHSIEHTLPKTANLGCTIFEEHLKVGALSVEGVKALWQTTQEWFVCSNEKIDAVYQKTMTDIDKLKSDSDANLAKLNEVLARQVTKVLAQDVDKFSDDNVKMLFALIRAVSELSVENNVKINRQRQEAFESFSKHSTIVLLKSCEVRLKPLEIFSVIMPEAQRASKSSDLKP